ncbi:transaldolase [Robiginitalea sp.]|nr:transaldolase [Robiginitalea sp.]
MKLFFHVLIPAGIILMMSCDNNGKAFSSTYFGGEIVNPTSDRVILFRGEEPIDSAFLDVNNHFEIRLDSLNPGLYHFFHQPEMQYVYLEPGDSLQVRLNTASFDESLAFSGPGEAINNYLINSFLEAETDENLIRDSLIPLEPERFNRGMDALFKRKLTALDQLRNEEQLSETGYEMARASLEYKNFYYRESYPFWHRKIGSDKTFHDLPKNFYTYRNRISYNNPAISFLRPYYEFMIYHVGNLAYMRCKDACDTEVENVLNQLHFNEHRLELIDSLIPVGELRDNLFRTVAFDYLLKHSNGFQVDEFMEFFNKVSANNRHAKEIQNLGLSIRQLSPGNKLPDLKVINTLGQEVALADINPDPKKQAQVFYFWSGREPRHLEALTTRITILQEMHPEYEFIGIALRTDADQWKNLIGQSGLNANLQFRAEHFERFAHSLVIYHPYKSILSKDGKVIDGFANLNSSF